MKKFRKDQILVLTMAILVVVAGYLNWVYKKPALDEVVEVSGKESTIQSSPSPDSISPSSISGGQEDKTVTTGSAGLKATASPQASPVTGTPDPATTSSSADYFSTAKINKETSRSQAMETLTTIIENKNSSTESKQSAEKELANMAKAIEKEGVIENLLLAKGYERAVVYINDDSANVVVKTKGLLPNEVSQIKDIVMSEAKISGEKVKIVEIR